MVLEELDDALMRFGTVAFIVIGSLLFTNGLEGLLPDLAPTVELVVGSVMIISAIILHLRGLNSG